MIKYVIVLLVGFVLGIITGKLKKEKIITFFYSNLKISMIVVCLILVTLVTYIAFYLNLFNEMKNNPEQMITSYVTVILAIVSAGFAIYQLCILKNRDVLKLYDLYDNLEILLETHVERIKKAKDGEISSDSIYMHRCNFSQDEINRIHELSILMNEHAKYQNSNENVKERNEIINDMLDSIYALNNFYNLCEKETVDTAISKTKLEDATKTLKRIKDYRSDLYKLVGRIR